MTALAAIGSGLLLSAANAAPVGSFPDANLTLNRFAGDLWTGPQQEAVDTWSAATHGKITIEAVPYENLHDKQALELSNGTYDIMYVHPSWFGEFVEAGGLLPIDKFINDPALNPPGFSRDSFISSILAQGAYKGKQYCLPDFVASVILAYRTDVFKKAGIAPPKTLDDVVAAAAKLNGVDGMAGITLPGKRAGAVADVMSTLITAHGNWWYNAQGRPSLDSAVAAKALKFYKDVAQYTPTGILNFHVEEVSNAAIQGRAAMAINITPMMGQFENPAKSATVGKWGYVALAADAAKPSGELIYWLWCIGSQSKSPAAAYSFIQYWTGGDQQAIVAKSAATMGATRDFYENKGLQASLPFLPALQAALGNTNPQPSLSLWPKAQDSIELTVQDVISGKVSPDQGAASLVKMLDDTLGK
jgi:ABC-type glycerol-3-phosphate transport system substrate-binding protein